MANTHSYRWSSPRRAASTGSRSTNCPGRPGHQGKAIVNLIQIEPGDEVATVLAVREFVENRYVVMATKRGTVKKTDLMEFSRPRQSGIIAINIADDDRLVAARLTDGEMQVFLATKSGQAIRFPEEEARAMGRNAGGVRGIDVAGDEVVAMETVIGSPCLLTVTENGYGKRTLLDEYPLRHRGGKGVITIKTTERNGSVVGVVLVEEADEVMLISDQGHIVRTRVADIKVIGRNTQGVRLIGVGAGERLVAVARLEEREEENGEEGSGGGGLPTETEDGQLSFPLDEAEDADPDGGPGDDDASGQ